VTASTTEEAKAALERIAATLGTPKPERHAYWRELGFEGWCEAYMEDLYTPETLELKKRHMLFGIGVGTPPLFTELPIRGLLGNPDAKVALDFAWWHHSAGLLPEGVGCSSHVACNKGG
jgi:hypothetical protein